jgi:putative ABC transport system ATP-binding protein
VQKTYGSGPTAYQALKGVDFVAEPGEFVMLSGPSGSGKTTLLSILGCVLTASSGTVKLFDDDISKTKESALPELRLSYVGFVFQSHNLLASLTATENVVMLLQLRGYSHRAAVAEAHKLLGEVGLGEKVDSKPGDLSGGQRQRVAIARALAGNRPRSCWPTSPPPPSTRRAGSWSPSSCARSRRSAAVPSWSSRTTTGFSTSPIASFTSKTAS